MRFHSFKSLSAEFPENNLLWPVPGKVAGTSCVYCGEKKLTIFFRIYKKITAAGTLEHIRFMH